MNLSFQAKRQLPSIRKRNFCENMRRQHVLWYLMTDALKPTKTQENSIHAITVNEGKDQEVHCLLSLLCETLWLKFLFRFRHKHDLVRFTETWWFLLK